MLTVEEALDEFFSLLPAWTDDRHKALIAIAFASGAYTAATLAVNGNPQSTRAEARAICERLQAAFDSIDAVH
jgi:hypothetical protein